MFWMSPASVTHTIYLVQTKKIKTKPLTKDLCIIRERTAHAVWISSYDVDWFILFSNQKNGTMKQMCKSGLVSVLQNVASLFPLCLCKTMHDIQMPFDYSYDKLLCLSNALKIWRISYITSSLYTAAPSVLSMHSNIFHRLIDVHQKALQRTKKRPNVGVPSPPPLTTDWPTNWK